MWNKLSMADKAKYIKLGVLSGITDLGYIKDSYNSYEGGGEMNGKGEYKPEKVSDTVSNPIKNYIPPQSDDPEIISFLSNWLNNRREQLYNNIFASTKFPRYAQNKSTGKYTRPRDLRGLNYIRGINPDRVDTNKLFYTEIENAASAKNSPIPSSDLGLYDRTDRTVRYEDYNDVSTRVHERTHAMEADPQKEVIQCIMRGNTFKFKKDATGGYDVRYARTKYWYNPSEIYSRLMEFRYNSKISPKTIVTKDLLDSNRDLLKKHDLDIIDDNTLIRLFNEVADNKNTMDNIMGNPFIDILNGTDILSGYVSNNISADGGPLNKLSRKYNDGGLKKTVYRNPITNLVYDTLPEGMTVVDSFDLLTLEALDEYMRNRAIQLPEVVVTPSNTPNVFKEAYNSLLGDSRTRLVSDALSRNPNVLDNWDLAANAMEAVNLASDGVLNRLSPTLNVGLVIDAMQGDNIMKSWFGNSGIVSDKYAYEHPYLALGINALGDYGVTKLQTASKFLQTIDKLGTTDIMNQNTPNTLNRLIGTGTSGYEDALNSGIIRGSMKIGLETAKSLRKTINRVLKPAGISDKTIRNYASNNLSELEFYKLKPLLDEYYQGTSLLATSKFFTAESPLEDYMTYLDYLNDRKVSEKMFIYSNNLNNPKWSHSWDGHNLPTFAEPGELLMNNAGIFPGDFGVQITNSPKYRQSATMFGHFASHPTTKYPLSITNPDVNLYVRKDGWLTGTKYMSKIPKSKVLADQARLLNNLPLSIQPRIIQYPLFPYGIPDILYTSLVVPKFTFSSGKD